MEKVRITIEVRDDVRRALGIHAASRVVAVGHVVDSLVLAGLVAEVEQARKVIAEGVPATPLPKGRLPKKKAKQ